LTVAEAVERADGAAWMGEIPEHWHIARLKYVAKLGTGHTPSRQVPEYWASEECTIPWVTLADVWQLRDGGRTTTITDTAEKISEVGLANSAAVLHPKGTVILSRTASVGFSAILGVDAATSQDFMTWTCGPRLEPMYLLYVLRAMKQEFRRLVMGSTHKTIYMPDIERLTIPLPPRPEQTLTVARIERGVARVDGLIERKRRVLTLLAERRRALINKVILRGLASCRMTSSAVGEVPAHWTVQPLHTLTPDYRQIMYGIVLPGPNFRGGVPIVKGGDVAPGRLMLERLSRTDPAIEAGYARSRLRGGDLVYAIRGSIGAVEMVPEELTGTNLTQDAARVAYKPETNGRWLLYALRAPSLFAQLDARATGATIRGINIWDLKRVRVPVPPRAEQDEIAEYLDEKLTQLDRLEDSIKSQVRNLTEHRETLIFNAVTGRLQEE
jgi:type I restriction enzyme, S subunit